MGSTMIEADDDDKLGAQAAEVKAAQFANLLGAAFFQDEAATESRIKTEALRKRTKAQRTAAKARPAKVRTEFMGFRTTPEVKRMIETLRSKLGPKATITDIIEAAVIAMAAKEGDAS